MSTEFSLPIDSKNTILKVKPIALTEEQLKVAMNNVYEASYTKVNEFQWYDLYPVAFSIAATLLIACLTSSFKDFSAVASWLSNGHMTFYAWSAFLVLFIGGIIGLCCKSSQKDGAIFEDRDYTVTRAINNLQAGTLEAS